MTTAGWPDPVFLHGNGLKKHIADPTWESLDGTRRALCGAPGQETERMEATLRRFNAPAEADRWIARRHARPLCSTCERLDESGRERAKQRPLDVGGTAPPATHGTSMDTSAEMATFRVLVAFEYQLPANLGLRREAYGAIDPRECLAIDLENDPASFMLDTPSTVIGTGDGLDPELDALRRENLELRQTLAREARVLEAHALDLSSRALGKNRRKHLEASVGRMRETATTGTNPDRHERRFACEYDRLLAEASSTGTTDS